MANTYGGIVVLGVKERPQFEVLGITDLEKVPVFVGENPLSGTYRRSFEGDYRCDAETVKRMLAAQIEDDRDSRIFEHFGINDLDESSFKTYRAQFRSVRTSHPWNDLDDHEFLRCLGGWKRDRLAGVEGLTLAGLLMFGHLRSILDVVPHYVVDYQERSTASRDERWLDRVTTDGSWSGNRFDFFRRVYARLTADLKIPFRLQGSARVDETPIHEA
jgi:ATP-dependent DNA helicase RecG